MLVDVAVQSYKKPESLIYTLLTLKEHSGDHIGTVWIDDDRSGDDSYEVIMNSGFVEMMKPITVNMRVNEKGGGLYYFNKRALLHRPGNAFWYVYYLLRGRHPAVLQEDDIRYQWAINNTRSRCLYITHDDVEFRGDIIGRYLPEMEKGYTIVGDLGQCWRCGLKEVCTPAGICAGEYPGSRWPLTSVFNLKQKRNCRINEWSCMIDVATAKRLAAEKALFFGAREDLGDIAAYWFGHIVTHGYRFTDPLTDGREAYYEHCWQGFAGNDTDIHGGENRYDAEMIRERIADRFGLRL